MNAYANHVVSYLLAQSWQIAILAAIVGLISFALRNRSAHLRYLLWLIVLAKCLVPPFLTVPLAVLPERDSSPSVAGFALPEEYSAREVPVPDGGAVQPRQPRLAVPSTRELATLAWIAGAMLFLVWVGGRAVRYTSWLHVRRRPLPPALWESIRELSAGFKFRQRPRIWLVDDISQPFVWGLLRGSVYLPADFAGVDGSDQRRSVLAHEFSHIARFDAGVNLLQVLAQAVYWFHPFVWWANRKIRQEREKCCDEMAVAHLNALPEQYTGAIVDALAAERRSAHPIPSLAIVGSVRDIEERIKTMLTPGKKFHKRPSLVAATVALLIALVTIPSALVLIARGETQPTGQSVAKLAQLPNKPAADSEKPAERRYAARTFNSKVAFDVYVQETTDDYSPRIGRTPSAAPLDIPACWLWEVVPVRPVEDWVLLIREMSQNNIPGLILAPATDSDLGHLAGFTGLQFLDLQNTEITDGGLAHIEGLTGLWGLSLVATSITGSGMEHLKGLTRLEWLNLLNAPFTDAGMQYLKELRGLRWLNLTRTKITGAGLEHLKGLTGLQMLSVRWTQITDADLVHLEGLTELSCLDLIGTGITGPGLEHLKGLPRLRWLNLCDTKVTDSGLANIGSLIGLRRLWLDNAPITDAGVEHLIKNTGWEELGLPGTQITDVGVDRLKGLTGLQRLGLANTQITDAGLAHLKGLTGLQGLDVGGTKITNTGLEHLKGLTVLTDLKLSGAQITDAGMVHLKGLTALSRLDLSNTRITDAGIAHLKGLIKLKNLYLDKTQIADTGLSHLKGLTGLQELWLSDTQITDAGLVHIKGLTGLTVRLHLRSTRITDAGLEHLKGLTRLHRLDLTDTQVTDAGVQQLKQSLPKLTIVR